MRCSEIDITAAHEHSSKSVAASILLNGGTEKCRITVAAVSQLRTIAAESSDTTICTAHQAADRATQTQLAKKVQRD